MPLPNPFKLQKLTIKVFSKKERQLPAVDSFEVMFNPESFQMSYENGYKQQEALNSKNPCTHFTHKKSEKVTLKLLFDGTGVVDMGITSFTRFATPSVSKQIEKFLKLCFWVDGSTHQPGFLKINWGVGELSDFNCVLASVEIDYTAFDRNGEPLRATLTTNFIRDDPPGQADRKPQLSSPDVAHAHVVRNGDTLPLLCQEIYGSARYYLQVAQANRLDNFRNLTPGATLIFPPLES